MSESASTEDRSELKETNIGPRTVKLPKDWEAVRLGNEEYSNWITQGPNPDYSIGTPSSKYRAIKTKDLYDDGVLYDNADKISEDTFENRQKYKLKENDLLVAIVGRGSIGKTYIFQEHPICEYIFTRAIGLVRPNPDGILPEYLHHYFQSHDAKEHFDQSITGSTGQEVLRTSAIKAMPVPLPPLPEQHRIADILSTVDDQIQQTDEIIEKRRELRQGLLQELFHQGVVKHKRILDPEELAEKAGGVNTGMDQTTIGQIPEGWETERLGELTEDSAYGVNASAEEFDPKKPRYLRITDIADDGHLKEDDPKSISRDVSEGYELNPDDLVFARTGATVGKTLLYQEGHPEAAYAGYLIRFQLDQTRILPKFVFYFTKTHNYDRWVSRITRQGAQENINTGEFCSILLPVPPISEQQKIVSILDTVNQKIEQERKTKKSLRELKRGLMQDLLTGKVRVATD